MNSSERFKLIVQRISDTHDRKQADYGTNEDPFANISASIDLGIEPWVGTILRMNDKMARIKSFIKKGTLQNESIQDSLLDICVYAAIALVKYEEMVEEADVNSRCQLHGLTRENCNGCCWDNE